ncbi:MAG: NAD(P)-dependent oxidoreductase, partial [Parvibaculales bacterium]
EAVQAAEIIFTCVGNDDDLRAVILGDDGVLAGLQQGGLLVDHTTSSADVARDVSRQLIQAGCSMLDAPVSGGEVGAIKGALTIMAGGTQADFTRALPLLNCYARAARLMGAVGAGQLTKMVNQICIAGLLEGLAEGLYFAEQAGLDSHAVIEVIAKGAAQSWQMDNRHKTMIDNEFDFGFAVDWMVKDLAIVLDESRKNGAILPVTRLVKDYYQEIQKQGGGRWDTSSLIARLRAIKDN